MRRGLVLLLTALLLVAPAQAEPPRVLLIGIDGAEPAVVRALLDAGVLPHLAALLAVGAWHDLQFTDHADVDGAPLPTVTKPGWAQIHTGEPWAITGVRSNERWAGPIPAGLTLPEQWAAAGARVGWVVSKPHLAAHDDGRKAPFWRVFRLAGVCAAYKPEASMAGLVQTALDCLAEQPEASWFMFVHFRKPDVVGHEYGPGSTRYREALIEVDTALGPLLAALPSETQIVAISDHGFCDTSPSGGFRHHACPDTWAISAPALPLGPRLLDVAPLLRP